MKKVFMIIVVSIILISPAFGKKKHKAIPKYHQYNLAVENDAVQMRHWHEQQQCHNPFIITFYEPTYILPAYYSSQHGPLRLYDRPFGEILSNVELKFQLSFKVNVYENFLNRQNGLYFAYTQQSYWQAYNNSAYFRATNYQPEVFFANNLCYPLIGGWRLSFVNFGLIHQSNGRGGDFERSWNRAYVEGILSHEHLMISVRPWIILNTDKSNRDIGKYLGHARLVVAYEYKKNIFSLETFNNIETGFQRGGLKLAWSYPILPKIRATVQYFNGYGQSLIEYNNRTSSLGIGIAFSDWIA